MAVKKKGALYSGSYITRLAKNLGVFSGAIALGGLIVKPKMTSLDIEVLKHMGLVKLWGNRYVLVWRDIEMDPDELGPAQP